MELHHLRSMIAIVEEGSGSCGDRRAAGVAPLRVRLFEGPWSGPDSFAGYIATP